MPNNIAAGDLVASAMRLATVIASNETPDAAELRDGLSCLNDMLENLSTENLAVWGESNETFSLVPNKATYTIGPGGDFATTRPVRIADGYVRYQGVDFPLVRMNQEEYNLISLKSQTQSFPERFLYVNDAPLGTITFWPVPTTAAQLSLSTDRVLTFPVTASTVLAGPPGFTKMLRFNLACEYGVEFGVEPPPTVVQLAADAKADFKRANKTPVLASYDAAIVCDSVATYQRGY